MRKARVVLLNPPTAAESTEILLSLAYLAASLRKHGHEVKVIDATAPYKKLTEEETNKLIVEFNPDFIGVTVTITYIAQTYEYLRKLKKLGIPVVAGGSHVNPLPEEALNNGVDIVALGEGENTILELADHFSGKDVKLEDIDGLCFKQGDGSVFYTKPRALVENLDDIPFPSFGDFPIKNYTGQEDVDSNPIFWSVFSSRGCPYNCTFCCGHNVFGRTYRLRSAQNIYDEIKNLVETFGVRKIAFQDDEILLSKKRILELCDLIESNNLPVKMSMRARIDSIDTDLLKHMKNVGFHRISFGIESWNDDTLEKINKRYKLEDIKKGFDVLERSDFPYVNVNTIVGFPWETKEHLKKNLEVISTIPKSVRYFSVVVTPIPYPNTELYKEYHKRYGFTDWWLDADKYWNEITSTQLKPIFFRFARLMTPLYVDDLYWDYTKKWKKNIEWFSWKVFKMYSGRHLTFIEHKLVYALSRASHFIWRISPRAEHIIFKCIPEKFISRIEKKLSFTKQD